MRDGCHCQKCQGQYATERRKERGEGEERRRKKRGADFRISKVLPPVSSSVQSDLASLCNNIQGGGQLLRAPSSLAAADLSRKRGEKKKKEKSRSRTGQQRRACVTPDCTQGHCYLQQATGKAGWLSTKATGGELVFLSPDPPRRRKREKGPRRLTATEEQLAGESVHRSAKQIPSNETSI